MNDKEPMKSSSQRNIIVLAIVVLCCAILSTTISLAIYNLSGDKYLDRSRPGFLAEDPDEKPETDEKYQFSDSGRIDQGVLDEYLQEYDKKTDQIDQINTPYSADALSYGALGIEE